MENCFWNLRYPFWHDHGLKIRASELTGLCRAALWYSDSIEISDTRLHGIKALRECSDVLIENCDIVSQEFGWSVKGTVLYKYIRASIKRALLIKGLIFNPFHMIPPIYCRVNCDKHQLIVGKGGSVLFPSVHSAGKSEGLHIGSSEADDPESAVAEWLSNLGTAE